MDKHQQALLTLIRDLVDLDPICSVFAVGSIGRGDYRPESDMDINFSLNFSLLVLCS